MKLSVIGSGYVGLVTGACLAQLGNKVTLIDTDEHKINCVNNSVSHFYEEGLEELLGKVQLEATSDYNKLAGSELIFICVGTPVNKDGSMCLDHIKEAGEKISEVIIERQDYCVIVLKSTVVPGTAENLLIPALESSGKRAGNDFGVAMSPEFLREGKAVYDFMNPARIIIGQYDKKSGDVLAELYKDFKAPFMRTDLRTAEMIKLASNAFLATKISFINEIGNISKKLNIDIYDVARGMGLDERIGKSFLNAGIGFGGSCLPKDIKALIAKAKETGYCPRILEEVLNLNEEQPLKAIDLLKKHVTINNSTIGILGLAFKPGTDDVRESRAIKIIKALLENGVKEIKAYDPMAAENFKKIFPGIDYVSKEEALESDAVIIITEWEEFNQLDYRGKVVIDGRKIAKAKEAKIYEGVCW